ncbi:MAG: peptidoglycan DD-metalloendopeptidase family protein [Bacteroidetes bacterium]|nr:peptidoglycan DD-metalloendopeptidase family protein [Bacteroidota bacterium]
MKKKLLKIIGVLVAGWLLVTLIWFGFDLDGRLDWNIGTQYAQKDSTDNYSASELEKIEKGPKVLYGINVDSFNVTQERVKANQFLTDILQPHGVSYATVDAIGRHWKDTFDVRRMRANHKYTVISKKDDAKTPAYFIYEIDNTDYVVYNLNDTLFAYRGKKPLKIIRKETAGLIDNSLYLTLEEQGASPALAVELSEVYAWAVDFYRIQKGDWFKVIYDEKWVDGQRVGIGKIYAALFNHHNQDYYAIYFDEDGQGGSYYDENNKSCRRSFLKAPLKFFRISSPYSLRRKHPVTGKVKGHFGTDYAAARGTPIMSTANGTVIEAQRKTYNGIYVKIKHNSVYTTQYLHMSKIADGIRPGVRVKQGQTIGYVGSTGQATGPHVCYRFWQNGVQVDSRKVKIPPAENIKKEYEDAYAKHKKEWLKKLEEIDKSWEEKNDATQVQAAVH